VRQVFDGEVERVHALHQGAGKSAFWVDGYSEWHGLASLKFPYATRLREITSKQISHSKNTKYLCILLPMSYLVAYIDGSSRSNSPSSGIGVVLEDPTGRRIAIAERVQSGDNNYAEYAALLAALNYAASSGCRRLQVFSDSEVVVRQINGQYHCRSRSLRQIYESCKTLIADFEHFAITHVRREQNSHANQLANASVERREPSLSAAALATEVAGY